MKTKINYVWLLLDVSTSIRSFCASHGLINIGSVSKRIIHIRFYDLLMYWILCDIERSDDIIIIIIEQIPSEIPLPMLYMLTLHSRDRFSTTQTTDSQNLYRIP